MNLLKAGLLKERMWNSPTESYSQIKSPSNTPNSLASGGGNGCDCHGGRHNRGSCVCTPEDLTTTVVVRTTTSSNSNYS